MVSASALFLALALQINSGHFHVVAVLLLGAALVAATLAVVAKPRPALERRGARAIELPTLGLAIAAVLVAHLFRPPGIHLDITGFWSRTPFYLGLVGVGLLVGALSSTPTAQARRAYRFC